MSSLLSPWRGVTAVFLFNGGLFGIWASRIPAFVESLQMTPGTLGLVLLSLGLGAIAGFPLAGVLVEKLGAKRATVGYGVCMIVLFLLLPLAPTPLVLGGILGLYGLVNGGQDVSMNAWGAEVETHMGRSVMSGFHAAFSFGAGIGAASGYAAVALGASPAVHFLLMGGLLAAQAGFFARVPWQSRIGSSEGGPLFALPRGTLLLVGVLGLAAAVGEGAMADWSALVLREAKSVGEAQAALGYAAFSVAMVAIRMGGGRLVTKFGPVRIAQISGISAVIGAIFVVLSPGLWLALVGFAAFGIGYAMIVPLAFSRAAADPDVPAGPAIASVATLVYGGILMGPPIIGAVAEALTLEAALGLLGVMAVLIVALAGSLRA